MATNNRTAPDISAQKTPRRKSRISKLFPFLIFLLFALFILKEQVPAINDLYQKTVKPAQFTAIKLCRTAALAKSQAPGTARLIDFGEANNTQGGVFVNRILVGEMVAGAGESRYIANCHIDGNGKLVNIHTEPYLAPAIQTQDRDHSELLTDQD